MNRPDLILAVVPALPAVGLLQHYTDTALVPIAVALIVAAPGIITIRNGRRRKDEAASLETRVDRLEAKVDLLVDAIIPRAATPGEEPIRRVK